MLCLVLWLQDTHISLGTLSITSSSVEEIKGQVSRWLKHMELLDEIITLWTAAQHQLLFCETAFEPPLSKRELPEAFAAFRSATGLYSVCCALHLRSLLAELYIQYSTQEYNLCTVQYS